MAKKQRKRTSPKELERAAAEMRANRGRWVKIPTHDSRAGNVVCNQRAGKIPALPPSEFESRVMDYVPYARCRLQIIDGAKTA